MLPYFNNTFIRHNTHKGVLEHLDCNGVTVGSIELGSSHLLGGVSLITEKDAIAFQVAYGKDGKLKRQSRLLHWSLEDNKINRFDHLF